MYVYMYVCMYVLVYVLVYVCMYVSIYIYICMYVCICICICICCQTPLVWNHVHGCLDIPLGLNNISGILPPFSTISGGWERSHRHGILEKRQGLGWVGTPISRVEIHIGSGASFEASHYSKTGLYFKFDQGSL